MSSLQWIQVIASLAVQTTLLLCVTHLLDRSLTQSRNRVRIWTIAYTSVLLLIASAILLPRLQLLNPWRSMEPRILVSVAKAEHVLGVTLVAIWVLGMCVFVLRWAHRSFLIRRFLMGCLPVVTESKVILDQLIPEGDRRVNGKDVRFLQGPEEIGPFCYHLHEPLVVLPASLFLLDRCDLKNVLVHELTHLQSQHAMQLLLEKVTHCLFWFHPSVWASVRKATLVREFECDDASSTDRSTTVAYLKTLLRVVESGAGSVNGVMPISKAPSQLRLRAERLSNRDFAKGCADRTWKQLAVPLTALFLSQLWLPTNPLASPVGHWSAWPSWSAAILHEVGISARDYEKFHPRTQLHELLLDAGPVK